MYIHKFLKSWLHLWWHIEKSNFFIRTCNIIEFLDEPNKKMSLVIRNKPILNFKKSKRLKPMEMYSSKFAEIIKWWIKYHKKIKNHKEIYLFHKNYQLNMIQYYYQYFIYIDRNGKLEKKILSSENDILIKIQFLPLFPNSYVYSFMI